LEAAAQDRDAVIEKQRRKINFLKAQLGGVNKVCICRLNFVEVHFITKSVFQQASRLIHVKRNPVAKRTSCLV
jgi:hypothetical protein